MRIGPIFSEHGRAALKSLASRFEVELWVWFREPLSYVRSEYVQMLKNPRVGPNCYGKDLSIDEVLDDKWFARRLDYIGFVREVQACLGAASVKIFRCDGNTIQRFLRELALEEIGGANFNHHRTIGQVGTEIIKIINRLNVDAEKKSRRSPW